MAQFGATLALPLAQPVAEATAEENEREKEKAECALKGGKWDEEKKICILPDVFKGEESTAVNPNVPPATEDPVLTFARANNLSLAAAADILAARAGQSPQKQLLRNSLATTNAEAGAREAEGLRQQKIARLVQAAQAGLLTPEELQQVAGADIDLNQVLGAGAASAVPGIAKGVATGVGTAVVGGLAAGAGTAGATALTGPGALIAGAAVAIGSITAGIISNLKKQQSEEFSADQDTLSRGTAGLNALIRDTNQHPENAERNIALFYQTLNHIDAAHMKTYQDSQENLNTFLGNDGTTQLAAFNNFDQITRQNLINKFNSALLNPNPNNIGISADELSMFDLTDIPT